MKKAIVFGLVLIIGGVAVGLVTLQGSKKARQAQAEQDLLLAAAMPRRTVAAPTYFPPSEGSLITGSELRALCETGASADASLASVLTHAAGEVDRRSGAADGGVTEARARELACELVERYGTHSSFDAVSVTFILKGHVNDGAVDW